MPSPVALASIGQILQNIPKEQKFEEQQQYDRGQAALAMALKQRGLDIDSRQVDAQMQNNSALRAIQMATAQHAQQQNDLQHAQWWASNAPSGSQVTPQMKPLLEQLGLGPQMQEQPEQLPSVSFGSAGVKENPALPEMTTYGGTRGTQMAEGNLDARNNTLDLSRQMQELRMGLAQDRLDLAKSRPPMWLIPTIDGYFRAPQQGGGATPVMPQGQGAAPIPGPPGAQPQPAAGQPQQSPDPSKPLQVMPPAALRGEALKLSPLYQLLADFKKLSPQVNTASGLARFTHGMSNSAGAMTQNNMPAAELQKVQDRSVALLARLSGEVGVLTEQDAERAKSWIPTIWDSKEMAEWKINQFETFLENKRGVLEKMNIPTPQGRGQQPAAGAANKFGLPLPPK